jgi:hypothetical protein
MQVEAEKREIETEGHLKLMANKETVSSNYWWATTCMALAEPLCVAWQCTASGSRHQQAAAARRQHVRLPAAGTGSRGYLIRDL